MPVGKKKSLWTGGAGWGFKETLHVDLALLHSVWVLNHPGLSNEPLQLLEQEEERWKNIFRLRVLSRMSWRLNSWDISLRTQWKVT